MNGYKESSLFYANRAPVKLDNYRPIAILNVIYEISACVFWNRLTHQLNLLTDVAQAA